MKWLKRLLNISLSEKELEDLEKLNTEERVIDRNKMLEYFEKNGNHRDLIFSFFSSGQRVLTGTYLGQNSHMPTVHVRQRKGLKGTVTVSRRSPDREDMHEWLEKTSCLIILVEGEDSGRRFYNMHDYQEYIESKAQEQ